MKNERLVEWYEEVIVDDLMDNDVTRYLHWRADGETSERSTILISNCWRDAKIKVPARLQATWLCGFNQNIFVQWRNMKMDFIGMISRWDFPQ